jgi:hypothetical protein
MKQSSVPHNINFNPYTKKLPRLAILKFRLFLNPNPASVAKIIQRITAKRPILQSEENRIFKRKKAVMKEAKPLSPNIQSHRIKLKKT